MAKRSLTISDIYDKKAAMECYRYFHDYPEYKIKERDYVDPRGISVEYWMGMLSFFQIFFPQLTKSMMKKILLDWRKEYESAEKLY